MTENSIGNSTGANAVRGVIVVAVAVAIGVFLMNRGLGTSSVDGSGEAAAAGTDTETTVDGATSSTAAVAETTTSTVTQDTRAPADVPVIVLNGNRIPGVAGKGTTQLDTFGYNTLEPGDTTEAAATTQILFAEGAEADARAVAEVFELDPDTFVAALTAENQPGADTSTAEVIVVIGQDNAIAFS